MNILKPFFAVCVLLCCIVYVGSGTVWGKQYEGKEESDLNTGVKSEIYEQLYHNSGNSALYRQFMQSSRYYNPTNKLNQIRPIAPYNSWFGAGMNVAGNGMGIVPYYSRRIDNRSFYQIRIGFTTLWHPYMRLSQPGITGFNDYGTTFLIPMLFSYKRYIGNNSPKKRLYPYYAAGAGPVFGMNLPAQGSPYNTSYSRAAMRFGPAAFAGMGVNIVMTKKYWLTVEGRYEVTYFPSSLGPRQNYSSPAVFVAVSRGFYF